VNVSAAILAGGKSRRMGRDKAWLDLGDGVPLVRRVAEVLATIGDELVVVAGDDRFKTLGLPVVADRFGEKGAFGGITTAVAATRGDLVCVAACDMPWPSAPVYALLLRLADGYDVVIPRIGEELETMHAVYRRSCLPAMERALARGDMRVISFFPDVRVREVGAAEIRAVDPELRAFENLNTPEDLERAKRAGASRLRPSDRRLGA
jgi:molybdopterin-guanine dinucleotide biosynthesis protein A